MALDQNEYDLAFEEQERIKKSQEQKKIFSFRSSSHSWDLRISVQNFGTI